MWLFVLLIGNDITIVYEINCLEAVNTDEYGFAFHSNQR